MGCCLGAAPLLARNQIVQRPANYPVRHQGNQQLYYHCSVFSLEIFLAGHVRATGTAEGFRVSLFRTGDNQVADVDDTRRYFNRPDQYNPANHILDQKCKIKCAFVFANALEPEAFNPGIEYRHHGALPIANNAHFIGIYARAEDIESFVRLLRVLHILGDNQTHVAHGNLDFALAASYRVDRSPADAMQVAFQAAGQTPNAFFRDRNRKAALINALR